MNRIPVVLVTGFLGSGKTTLLRHLAATHPEWRLVFLVNEFADSSIDGETLAATGTPTQSVVGGSLFCECKAGDFLRTMRGAVLDAHRQAPLDVVVIETSGMAHPDGIGQLMEDHNLTAHFVLRHIVTIVAPAKFLRLIGNLPVVEAQLRVSDLIVINKTDTVDASTLDTVEASIRSANERATIVRAEYCHFDFVLPTRFAAMPRGPLSTCEANPFSTAEGVWPPNRSLAEARAWLDALPETILRAKGRIRTPEGIWQVERTVDGLTMTATGDGREGLVLIAHDDHPIDLREATRPLSVPSGS